MERLRCQNRQIQRRGVESHTLLPLFTVMHALWGHPQCLSRQHPKPAKVISALLATDVGARDSHGGAESRRGCSPTFPATRFPFCEHLCMGCMRLHAAHLHSFQSLAAVPSSREVCSHRSDCSNQQVSSRRRSPRKMQCSCSCTAAAYCHRQWHSVLIIASSSGGLSFFSGYLSSSSGWFSSRGLCVERGLHSPSVEWLRPFRRSFPKLFPPRCLAPPWDPGFPRNPRSLALRDRVGSHPAQQGLSTHGAHPLTFHPHGLDVP